MIDKERIKLLEKEQKWIYTQYATFDYLANTKLVKSVGMIVRSPLWYQFVVESFDGRYFRAYISATNKGEQGDVEWEFDLDLPDERFYVHHKEASVLPDKIRTTELAETLRKWYNIVKKELGIEDGTKI